MPNLVAMNKTMWMPFAYSLLLVTSDRSE